jgi:RNA polymerase sigma-70 factor (ECF subfamily)
VSQAALRVSDSTFDCSESVLTEPESDGVLFRRYARYVAYIGFRLLRSESDVDDLVQQVFMTAFKQREQLRDHGAARSWLATITVRTAQRQLRRRKLRQFVGIDERPVLQEMRDPGLSPERSALLARVYEILDTLPVQQRVAWTLRYVEGEKLADVAERCGCSLASAKRRITAAHAHLLAELEIG